MRSPEAFMKVLVTGAAGFIGSNLVDRLLADGHTVIGVDNYSSGKKKFIGQALLNPRFKIFERDLLDKDSLNDLLNSDVAWVFHLAANEDVRFGLNSPTRDLQQNVIVTSNVLEAMRRAGTHRIVFTSAASIYGEAPKIPTPENANFPVQTSFYGASKLAAEGLISAYCEGYQFQGLVFRMVSVLGERYTHGHVMDFVSSLKKDSSQVRILGDGKQKKSYLHVGDFLSAIGMMLSKKLPAFEVFNLGSDECVSVDESLSYICEELQMDPRRTYSGGTRGWTGDNPHVFLDCVKIKRHGWKPSKTILQSVQNTVQYLLERGLI